jgi:hypothetical protein
MSDLSRLLEDVYRSGPAAPAAPAWSSDSALEDAFADWVPGPPEDAPAAEREFAETTTSRTPAMDQLDALMQAVAMAPDAVDDDEFDPEPLKTAAVFDQFDEFDIEPVEAAPVEAAPVDAPVAAEVERLGHFQSLVDEQEPEAEAEIERKPIALPSGTWSREDDDILPNRGHGRRRLSLKRR